jgi:hypothetical protein
MYVCMYVRASQVDTDIYGVDYYSVDPAYSQCRSQFCLESSCQNYVIKLMKAGAIRAYYSAHGLSCNLQELFIS